VNEKEISAILASTISKFSKPRIFPRNQAICCQRHYDRRTHGAALANIVFCQPGTRVVEIIPVPATRLVLAIARLPGSPTSSGSAAIQVLFGQKSMPDMVGVRNLARLWSGSKALRNVGASSFVIPNRRVRDLTVVGVSRKFRVRWCAVARSLGVSAPRDDRGASVLATIRAFSSGAQATSAASLLSQSGSHFRSLPKQSLSNANASIGSSEVAFLLFSAEE